MSIFNFPRTRPKRIVLVYAENSIGTSANPSKPRDQIRAASEGIEESVDATIAGGAPGS